MADCSVRYLSLEMLEVSTSLMVLDFKLYKRTAIDCLHQLISNNFIVLIQSILQLEHVKLQQLKSKFPICACSYFSTFLYPRILCTVFYLPLTA